ncbi:MAG: ComEC/Rec2 family competence protein [Dysgonamonadaceae bacterium]|jgi:competence protein ComEC|nr:ComEC/Rec2 family competence protein [Dysgonamonadaceae bacterium]MDD3356966.1 ComEC/Rec2 family competence protein [Dysgonamonadaceae bacterium]MDD3727135.1 ComEC/Rec2 family competence protein [Dysgonamonadaceae bacterium]MDD4245770.1 ComEC/Rec2 family competence protein [Dysgonamonadaceae bacterium]HUI32661.1 ComEC/Rec2 family competence protein [Dysgonamonadaceae bacterium]
MNKADQTPFLRLLIPVVAGILFCRFISASINLYSLGLIGLLIILFSFLKRNYSLRGIFGVGLMLFLFSFTVQSYQYQAKKVSYNFPEESQSYIAKILDLPQQKRRSVACEVQLTYPINKKVLLYFEPENRSQALMPGDQIIVQTSIKPIKNLGNPDDFDYKRFMEGKGFAGTAFVPSNNWVETGLRSRSVKTEALRARAKILDQYKTFNLSPDEYAFLSALTLGYKANLSNELKEAFRASGTSHILAVSGLHVGIVYLIIMSLFSFLGKRGKWFILKQLLILLFLWGYVFITGMPVSVIRAAIMLSLFCVGSLFHKSGFTYNTLAAAAFFILLANPFYLFSVGFQLSFASVFSILFFQPKLSILYVPQLKISHYVWDLLTVTTSAQLGVFPLTLYYFGTFPTYFFITNTLVLPFIGLIIYLGASLTLFSFLLKFNLEFVQLIYELIAAFLQFFIKTILQIVYFFESLPWSTLVSNQVSLPKLFLILIGLYALAFFILHKRAKMLITFLFSISLFLLLNVSSYFNKPINQLVVYNNFSQTEMAYRISGKKVPLYQFENQIIDHPTSTIVLLTDNLYKSKKSEEFVEVDYLILASDNSFSMNELHSFFKPNKVIIDSSISRYAATKIINECQKLNIAFHDISDSGAYSINF